MKLRLGIVCIAAAVVLLAVAITMRDYAMVVAMLGVGFALVGTGLLCEATDPRRKPNPRTVGRAEGHDYPLPSWGCPDG